MIHIDQGCAYCHRAYASADQVQCDGCGAPRLIEQATTFIDPLKDIQAAILEITSGLARAADLVER